MSDDSPRPLPESSPLLWFAILAGPIAWSAHLLISYGLVPTVCDTGWTFLLVIVSIATAAASLAGALVSRRLPQPRANGDDRTSGWTNAAERMRFIAHSGYASGLFFAAVIAAQTLPILFLDPCWWGSG